jgi:hypothetical protein
MPLFRLIGENDSQSNKANSKRCYREKKIGAGRAVRKYVVVCAILTRFLDSLCIVVLPIIVGMLQQYMSSRIPSLYSIHVENEQHSTTLPALR